MKPHRMPLTPFAGVGQEMLALVTEWRNGDRLEASFRAGLLGAYAHAEGWFALAGKAHTLAAELRAPVPQLTEETRMEAVIALAAEHMGILAPRVAP
ncbi:hypothetical protein L2Y96_12665 [Luteibacter aegosomaticola]|uniref:hypothetical protein n=1 Tax=Luteibacter aegosomaticola TaxID=2911538 RepID=UPI001FF79C93|nr:hypothetical protein [Luteibacter aegosomaticola]UPG88272.1 hypothetical protein L2Y96_12665 [Luteibacter aegosomaticola]